MATSKFGKAFAAARKAGKKEFSFGGKRYNTKTRDEDAPKNVPTPTANPAKAKSGASRSTEGKVSAKSGASRSTSGKVTEKKPREKIFSSGKNPSFAERNKPKQGPEKPEEKKDKKIFTLKKNASFAERNKKKPTKGGGGGW